MFQKILAPIDIDDASTWQEAIPFAAEIATTHKAALHILNVVPTYGMSIVGSFFSVENEREMIRNCRQRLVEIVASTAPDTLKVKAHIAHGTVYEEILLAAEKLGIDLIVMMANRPQHKNFSIGPNAERVARHAKQSVFILRK